MFTSEQSGLRIQYFDPETKRLRYCYPDFFLLNFLMVNIKLLRLKAIICQKIKLFPQKKAAAEEFTASTNNSVDMEYVFYAGSEIMKTNVLEDNSEQIELI